MTEDTKGTLAKTILVRIDKDLEELIPGYIANRQKDVALILSLAAEGDYEPVRVLAHSMKGSGGGYGFDEITKIGARMEAAAKKGDMQEIKRQVDDLKEYLERIEVVYE